MGVAAMSIFETWKQTDISTNSWPPWHEHVLFLEVALFVIVILLAPQLGCYALSSSLQVSLLQHPEPCMNHAVLCLGWCWRQCG